MTQSIDPAALLDAMTQGMYVVDPNRSITFWNAAATRITGYSEPEAIGRFCGDGMLNHVDESGASLCGSRCPLRGTIADGRTRSIRVYLHHREGHLVPVNVVASALRDDAGEIIGAVETFTDDSAMNSALHRLHQAERRAATDALTGIGNRRHLEECLERRLEEWETRRRTFGALMIDVDHFKAVNDSAGHAAGDAVLRTIARSLTHATRGDDDVARFGGEEFVVLTEAAGTDQLLALAARIRMVIAQGRYPGLGELRVTASIGAALVHDGDSSETLLARADQALLAAKAGGRDAVVAAP